MITGLFILLLLGAARPFGCLQGVDLLGAFLNFHFHMSRCRTNTQKPSAGRIGVYFAIFAVFPLEHPEASFTLFTDRFALATNESAALLRHKGAFRSILNGLANHRCHLD